MFLLICVIAAVGSAAAKQGQSSVAFPPPGSAEFSPKKSKTCTVDPARRFRFDYGYARSSSFGAINLKYSSYRDGAELAGYLARDVVKAILSLLLSASSFRQLS